MNNQNWTLQSTMETRHSLPDELLLEGTFCDAVIKVENLEFQVHKVVMCVCDPFFSDLFLKSSDRERRDFLIEGVSPEIMSQIIDFAYTGSVSLTSISELMITANQLNMLRLGEAFSNILKDQLCPENCIGMWHFTKNNPFLKLQREAFDFICAHFEEVALCGGFLQLAMQELADILGRDDLNVSKEVQVYESVLRWINHKPEERQGTIATLLSKVRLGLMDLDYIRNNVSNNDLVRTNIESHLMVLLRVIGSQSRIINPQFCPRLPNTVLLVVGGGSLNGHFSGVEAYDYWTNSWIRVHMSNPVPDVRFHGTVFLDGSVYIIGGYCNTERCFSNSVYKFNSNTHTWREVCPMHQQRGNVSVTVLNGCIYAMGGHDGHAPLNTAECYQPNIDQWTLIASMNDKRTRASCSTLNNTIYICGGHNGRRTLETAEYYNLNTNKWTLITPMGTGRRGLAVIAYVDHIFAVGGIDCNGDMSSAEAYNPVTNAWHNVPDMIQTRSYFGVAVINKKLFVVSNSTEVECYDSKTDSWSEVCSTEVPRFGLSCCVISGLSNMDNYCVSRDPASLRHYLIQEITSK